MLHVPPRPILRLWSDVWRGAGLHEPIPLKSHPIRDSSPLTSCSRHLIEVDISTRSVCLGDRV